MWYRKLWLFRRTLLLGTSILVNGIILISACALNRVQTSGEKLSENHAWHQEHAVHLMVILKSKNCTLMATFRVWLSCWACKSTTMSLNLLGLQLGNFCRVKKWNLHLILLHNLISTIINLSHKNLSFPDFTVDCTTACMNTQIMCLDSLFLLCTLYIIYVINSSSPPTFLYCKWQQVAIPEDKASDALQLSCSMTDTANSRQQKEIFMG